MKELNEKKNAARFRRAIGKFLKEKETQSCCIIMFITK